MILTDVFLHSQAYVALSRVRRMEGVMLVVLTGCLSAKTILKCMRSLSQCQLHCTQYGYDLEGLFETALAQAKGVSLVRCQTVAILFIHVSMLPPPILDLAALCMTTWLAARMIQVLSLVCPQSSGTSNFRQLLVYHGPLPGWNSLEMELMILRHHFTI